MEATFPSDAVSDAGFVVEWQLGDDADAVIDLSTAEAQIREPAPAGRAPGATVQSPR